MAVPFYMQPALRPSWGFWRCQVYQRESPGLRVRSSSKAHAIVVKFSRHSAIRRLLLLISPDNAAVVEPFRATIGDTTCLSHVGSGPKQPDCFSPARSRFEWSHGPDTLHDGRGGKREACRLLPHVRSRWMRHSITGPGLRHQRTRHGKSRSPSDARACMGRG